jgi:hypothetical protein
MFVVSDCAEFEQLLVKCRQPRQIVGAEVHMVEFKFH